MAITHTMYPASVTYKMWHDKQNRKFLISDMTTDHIIASLNKCIRDQWRTAHIPLFLDELRSRGVDKTHPELFI